MSTEKSSNTTQANVSGSSAASQTLDNKAIREIESSTGEVESTFVVKDESSTNIRFYPDKPTQRIHKDRFIIKEPSRFYDPCAESSKMAVRCMESHDETYKEVCVEYFKAYRECKKEWMQQRKKDGNVW